MALTVGYMGARNDHPGLGGSNDTAVNINQLDPEYLALGSALNDAVPNPFFGDPTCRCRSRPRRRCSRRGCCCLPAVPPGQRPSGDRGVQPLPRRRRRADPPHARRLRRPLQLHLQRAEGQPRRRANFYTAVSPGLPVNNYNYVASLPACAAGQQFTTRATTRAPNTATACSMCRTACSSRRCRAAVRQGQALGERRRVGDRMSAAGRCRGGQPSERFSVERAAGRGCAPQPGRLDHREPAEPRGGRRPREAVQPPKDRLATADHPTAAWLNPAAFSRAPRSPSATRRGRLPTGGPRVNSTSTLS